MRRGDGCNIRAVSVHFLLRVDITFAVWVGFVVLLSVYLLWLFFFPFFYFYFIFLSLPHEIVSPNALHNSRHNQHRGKCEWNELREREGKKWYLFSQCQHKRPCGERANTMKCEETILQIVRWSENWNTCVDSTVCICSFVFRRFFFFYLHELVSVWVWVLWGLCAKPICQQLFQNILNGFTEI